MILAPKTERVLIFPKAEPYHPCCVWALRDGGQFPFSVEGLGKKEALKNLEAAVPAESWPKCVNAACEPLGVFYRKEAIWTIALCCPWHSDAILAKFIHPPPAYVTRARSAQSLNQTKTKKKPSKPDVSYEDP